MNMQAVYSQIEQITEVPRILLEGCCLVFLMGWVFDSNEWLEKLG
jgi:hypothetical protein